MQSFVYPNELDKNTGKLYHKQQFVASLCKLPHLSEAQL